jgi:hypothetical protein
MISEERGSPKLDMKIQGYVIRIQAQVSESMMGWFEGVKIENIEGTDSVLTLPSADQAVLFGLLLRIRDLSIRLISVNPIEESQQE